jgi:hypothetical protein
MYQQAETISSLSPSPGTADDKQSLVLEMYSNTVDPSRSAIEALDMISITPRFSQISIALGHSKKACFVVSHPTLQTGQRLGVMIKFDFN